MQKLNKVMPIAASLHENTVRRFNWDDVHLFVLVADVGSLRAAAAAIAMSVNAVRRRIQHLEYQLDAKLFIRRPTGVELTADGRKVYTVGMEMLQQAQMLGQLSFGEGRGMSGLVRIGVTEGLGTFWVVPRLVDFRRDHPQIKIDLRCEMRVPDVSRLESDIAIQLERPRDPDLIVTKLGTLHLVLFASKDYIAEHGMPSSTEDLHKYQFVELVADQIPSELLQEHVRNDPQYRFVSICTNTSSAHAFAIARGAGIGALPTYARALTKRIKPIDTNFHLKRDIWLVYHSEAAKLKRVQAAISWLKDSFSPLRYPWFRDEFVHPLELEESIGTGTLFEGFIDRHVEVA